MAGLEADDDDILLSPGDNQGEDEDVKWGGDGDDVLDDEDGVTACTSVGNERAVEKETEEQQQQSKENVQHPPAPPSYINEANENGAVVKDDQVNNHQSVIDHHEALELDSAQLAAIAMANAGRLLQEASEQLQQQGVTVQLEGTLGGGPVHDIRMSADDELDYNEDDHEHATEGDHEDDTLPSDEDEEQEQDGEKRSDRFRSERANTGGGLGSFSSTGHHNMHRVIPDSLDSVQVRPEMFRGARRGGRWRGRGGGGRGTVLLNPNYRGSIAQQPNVRLRLDSSQVPLIHLGAIKIVPPRPIVPTQSNIGLMHQFTMSSQQQRPPMMMMMPHTSSVGMFGAPPPGLMRMRFPPPQPYSNVMPTVRLSIPPPVRSVVLSVPPPPVISSAGYNQRPVASLSSSTNVTHSVSTGPRMTVPVPSINLASWNEACQGFLNSLTSVRPRSRSRSPVYRSRGGDGRRSRSPIGRRRSRSRSRSRSSHSGGGGGASNRRSRPSSSPTRRRRSQDARDEAVKSRAKPVVDFEQAKAAGVDAVYVKKLMEQERKRKLLIKQKEERRRLLQKEADQKREVEHRQQASKGEPRKPDSPNERERGGTKITKTIVVSPTNATSTGRAESSPSGGSRPSVRDRIGLQSASKRKAADEEEDMRKQLPAEPTVLESPSTSESRRVIIPPNFGKYSGKDALMMTTIINDVDLDLKYRNSSQKKAAVHVSQERKQQPQQQQQQRQQQQQHLSQQEPPKQRISIHERFSDPAIKRRKETTDVKPVTEKKTTTSTIAAVAVRGVAKWDIALQRLALMAGTIGKVKKCWVGKDAVYIVFEDKQKSSQFVQEYNGKTVAGYQLSVSLEAISSSKA